MAAIRTAKGGRNGALSRMQGFRGSNRIPSLTFQHFAGRRFASLHRLLDHRVRLLDDRVRPLDDRIPGIGRALVIRGQSVSVDSRRDVGIGMAEAR